MRPLKPFAQDSLPLELKANLQVEGRKWVFEYELLDPQGVVEDAPTAGHWKNWKRADGLWQSTCFEAFVGIPGERGYWEFNFSPARQSWNAYFFENYREPQPPRASYDFEFEEASFAGNLLRCSVNAKIDPQPFEAGLTAVIRTGGGASYYALAHAAGKADFHRRETFSLRL